MCTISPYGTGNERLVNVTKISIYDVTMIDIWSLSEPLGVIFLSLSFSLRVSIRLDIQYRTYTCIQSAFFSQLDSHNAATYHKYEYQTMNPYK